MNTDTPETDAQCYDCEYRGDMGGRFTADPGKLDPYGDHVASDFARNLERQRNNALSIIEESIDALDGEINIDWRNESRELLRKLGEHLESVSNKARLRKERDDALAALEREQMRLVACDVIAMCDTPESAAEARKMHPDYESAALDSVKRRVDECIALRQMVRELRDALQGVADNGHADDCLLLNRANAECDCGVDAAYLLITKANQLLP